MTKAVVSSPSAWTTKRTYVAPGKPVAADGELEAMRAGMGELVDLLSYARPHGTDGEFTFLRDWFAPKLREIGVCYDLDEYGNFWVKVDAPKDYSGPNVLWSCHVDTVHKATATRQGVRWADDGRTLELTKRKPGRCLGADDGAGLWLMLQMMRAGIPGGYVFHRGEEVGRLGSTHVADNEPGRLKDFDACVAFDRRDYADFITHQMGERCASVAFAESMCAALNGTGHGLSYVPDDTGSYTDSYSYAGLISECCNVSVGYDGEHGPRETLDALHLWRLSQAIIAADLSGVVCERDCTVVDYGWDSYPGYTRGWVSGGREGSMGARMDRAAWGDSLELDDDERLLEFIRRFPGAIADCLNMYGLSTDDLADHLTPLETGQAMAAGLVANVEPARVSGGGWDWDKD